MLKLKSGEKILTKSHTAFSELLSPDTYYTIHFVSQYENEGTVICLKEIIDKIDWPVHTFPLNCFQDPDKIDLKVGEWLCIDKSYSDYNLFLGSMVLPGQLETNRNLVEGKKYLICEIYRENYEVRLEGKSGLWTVELLRRAELD